MGKKEFSLGGRGNSGIDILKSTTDAVISESAFNLQFIAPDKIVPNELNKRFEQEDIDALSRSIEDIGLQHNLVVLDNGDGTYKLVSGERRYRAILKLLERNPGYKAFRAGIPCKVTAKLDSVKEEICLIRANTDVRELKGEEKRQAILRLIELYQARVDNGEIVSAHAELAKDLDMSIRQIQKYAATGKLISELEEMLKSGEITLKDASSYGTLDEDSQHHIYELYKSQNGPSRDDLEEIRQLKEEKERMTATLYEKIQSLMKERDALKQQIDEAQATVDTKMTELESAPISDIEQIVLDKSKAEEKVRSLTERYEDLKYKNSQLKKRLEQPVEINPQRAKQIKIQVRMESILTTMSNEISELDKGREEIAVSEELFEKLELIRKRLDRTSLDCIEYRNKHKDEQE